MFNWYNNIIVWSFQSNRIMFAVIVVITMAVVGTVIGLLADIILRFTGIDFGEYTDSHT